MKTILLKILMLISTLISIVKTPLSMGILLLLQTTIATMLISYTSKSSWMSMIMFLMFVGGLLIIFMYMSSIASNEKFSPNFKLMILMLMVLIPSEDLLWDTQMNDQLTNFTNNEMIALTKIFNKKTFGLTIMMFMYMFTTMITITNIIKIHSGPLRSK
uniref:NADH-ubiquinone oxidoreductase chain 6 n=1 Tax=Yanocephalus yanonis TaxID=317752 RepID=A0A343KJ54_9HEMI|nr:NADH dehydrogenase subunit 6 [Yanocephalus yanonis]ATG83159.1 NADH dehydrogenase subunit 6 [Yanocephalus yanonis]